MAQYIVTRTSKWGEKPVDEAVPCEVHEFFCVTGRAQESYRNQMRERVDVKQEFDDGGFCGYMKGVTDAWMCDIPDLHAFVEKYGKIILKKPQNKEGYWEVEIYDDFRE